MGNAWSATDEGRKSPQESIAAIPIPLRKHPHPPKHPERALLEKNQRNRREKWGENVIYTDGQKQSLGGAHSYPEVHADSTSEAFSWLPPKSCQEALG